jgi:CRISPR-associated protein Cas2
MYVIIVYDTEAKNCAKMHKFLKKYLHWNQRSVFEGTVTASQYLKIETSLDKLRAPCSHIVLYSLENDKLLTRKELGKGDGNVDNII